MRGARWKWNRRELRNSRDTCSVGQDSRRKKYGSRGGEVLSQRTFTVVKQWGRHSFVLDASARFVRVFAWYKLICERWTDYELCTDIGGGVASQKCGARKPRRFYASDWTQCTVMSFFFKLQPIYVDQPHINCNIRYPQNVYCILKKYPRCGPCKSPTTPHSLHRRVVYLLQKFCHSLRHVLKVFFVT